MSTPEEAFTSCSGDGEGLNRKQTYAALWMCEKFPKGSDVASFFEEYGVEEDGTISLEQFVELCGRPVVGDAPSKEELAEAFKHFDKDGNGTIEREELNYILKKVQDTTGIETELDDATVDAIWNAIDVNGDGVLNYEELADYITEKGSLTDAMLEQQSG